MRATYNITDDKIRAQFDSRLGEEDYKKVKAANFVWWPGQKIFVAKWSVQAEDALRDLGITEIEEDDTPDDVEARVERFAGHAEKAEASAESAEAYSQEATTARRRELAASRAAREYESAEYWQRRIERAISHARVKESPGVIARRIKGLEADHRKFTKEASRGGSLSSAMHSAYDYQTGKYDKEKLEAGAMAHASWANRWLVHIAQRLEYERALLKAAGGLPTDEKKLEVGGGVLLRDEWCEITKVNRTTFNAKSSRGWGNHIKWGMTEAKGIMTPAEWTAYNKGEFDPAKKEEVEA